ncbi:MAG: hypothetical protein J6Q54_06910, partial [Oscillospiraceae bacterium]|nr:hypothetical protein [Oscillospiraceae bacterium]
GYVDQRNLITKIDTSLTNLDPNRDMLSLNLLEQRHYLKAIQLLDPIAELDGHERQRNSFVGDIQISMSWQPDSSQALFDIQEEMLQSIFGALEAVDLSGAWYSDYVNTDGVDQTRGYAGNQGRIQFLMETRGIYMGNEAYGSRTASHIVTAMEYLRLCAENAQQILQIVTAEREHIAKAGETYEDTDTITLSYGSVAVPELDMLTDHYSLQGGEVKTQKAKLYVVNKTRVAPTAYVIPANLPKIAVILELMELQEIDYYFLPANTAIPVQQYSGTVDADRVTTNVALTEEQYVVFPDGAYVLQMNQANGKNLAYLMEPDSPSNADLVQQGRIAVDSNGNFPIYRYIRDLKQDSIGVDYVQAQSAPQNIQVVDAGVAANDGMITGLDGEKLYEYKASGADSYTKLPAGTTQITGLTPDTYYLRYQADFYGVPGQAIVCTIGCNVTVYVSSAGSDTGAGTTEATALKTLEAAYTKLADILGDSGDASRGTIILLNDYTITSDARVDMPSHTFPVSILGKTATVKLIFKPTVISESTQQLAFHGPTTLDNLELRGESTSKLDYIYACGNPFTIGANLTTSARSSMPILVAGDYRAAAEDTDMTVLGGTWYGVYAGSFRAGHTGTAKLTINGAKIDNFIRGKYTGATTGNIEVILENTNFTKFNIGYNGDMSGTTKVTLRQGAVGTVFTNNGNSGNITGTVTVVMDGANREQVVFENTSATVTKDVLVFASGYATRETGFSEIHIITEDTVTLAEDMTVDYIAGGGTVELNGYHLAGEGAYGMDAAVTSVSLRPNVAGLYYSGNFRVSDALAGAAYGIVLSTEDETPVAQEQTTSLYTVGATSVLVKDIMKAGSSENKQNATTRVYARAYVKLADGTTIYSNTVKVTLRQLVVAVDAKWDALTDVQKQGLKALYETFATDMANWNIPNMKKA